MSWVSALRGDGDRNDLNPQLDRDLVDCPLCSGHLVGVGTGVLGRGKPESGVCRGMVDVRPDLKVFIERYV